jgi:hypothetical protein
MVPETAVGITLCPTRCTARETAICIDVAGWDESVGEDEHAEKRTTRESVADFATIMSVLHFLAFIAVWLRLSLRLFKLTTFLAIFLFFCWPSTVTSHSTDLHKAVPDSGLAHPWVAPSKKRRRVRILKKLRRKWRAGYRSIHAIPKHINRAARNFVFNAMYSDDDYYVDC